MERKPRRIKGKTVMVTVHAHEKELWAWRDSIVEQARPYAPPEPLNGAVRVDWAFWLPVPPSAPKRRQIPANTLWDLSKLIRAAEDALTDAGFFPTDGRITDFGPTKKRYAYDRAPGVTVTVAETDGLS
jgi:Holliday junction resolvase RusA-like endonuclease